MVFIFFVLIVFILLVTSKIRIEITNLKYISNHLNDYFNIKINLQILGKLTVLCFNINKPKINKWKNNKKLKIFNMKGIKKHISIKKINQLKKIINFSIKKIKLKAEIGTDSTILTTMIIPTISSIIAILLAVIKVKYINQYFEVKPVYNRGNFLNVELSGIFEIKFLNIKNNFLCYNKN